MKDSAVTIDLNKSFTPAGFNQREAAFMFKVYGKAGMFCHFADIDITALENRECLEDKLKVLINSHESLRSYLVPLGETHAYISHSAEYVKSNFKLAFIDLRNEDDIIKNDRINGYWEREVARGFDIYKELPIRAALVALRGGRYKLFLSVHHIACDEYSLNKLINSLFEKNNTVSNSKHGNALLGRRKKDPQLLADFWQEQLQNCPSLYSYPVCETRQEKRSFALSWHKLALTNELVQSINEITVQESISPEEFFLAAFQLFMHIYCQQEFCTVGINHYPTDHDLSIGNWVNRLPLVSQLTNISVRDWLAAVKGKVDAAQEHGDIPFGEIVDVVHADKAVNYHPIFQALFSYAKSNTQEPWFNVIDSSAPMFSHFDLRFSIIEKINKTYDLNVGLSSELFSVTIQQNFINYFKNLLENIVRCELNLGVQKLRLTNDSQMRSLQDGWLQSIAAPESFPTIHACFQQQVESQPNHIAVYHYDETLTYHQLNERANQCARYILEKAGNQGAKVAVETDNPCDMLVALMAAFKAGCVYIPIDPDLPVKRVEYIVENADTSLFITHAKDRYQPSMNCMVLPIDEFMGSVGHLPKDNLGLDVAPSDLAYYIYTSGSTGKPKGVMVKHAGVVNIGWTMKRLCHVTPQSCFLLFASFGFDASVNDWAGALCNGASLALVKRSNTNIVDEVKNSFKRHPVSIALIPPSFLSFFHPSDFPTLETLIVAAEAVNQKLIEKWTKDFLVINGYGPTETTVICSTFECNPAYPPNTIGKAVDNCVLMVLDSNLNPLPPNVVGELYIGGIGLAVGYVGATALTEASFINADIEGYGSVRLYKSNDLVKLSEAGNIEFVKRNDRVEKIRGFRVSLTEIDHTLEQHPYIDHSISISNADEDKSIFSYVVLNGKSMSKFDTVDQWRNIFENSIDYDSRNEEKTFNVSGWSSSYTGLGIPDGEMAVWLSSTTERILSLKPKKLLEVGCGSGLLLFKVAPTLDKYVGTDISKDALLSIKKSMPDGGIKGVSVAVHRLPANDLSAFEDKSFDTIVCNSVIQYFPSMNYFVDVLDGFFRVLDDGGKLFLGDIRNKNLASHFHVLVEQEKNKEARASELQFKVDQRVHRDPELLIEPEFFQYLKQKYPQVTRVRTLIKRGYAHNEMNQFRYDVVIETGAPSNAIPAKQYTWLELASIAAVEKALAKSDALIIRNIPNARITSAIALLGNKHVESFKDQAMEPEAFFELGERKGLHAEVIYAVEKDNCYFDVAFSIAGTDILGSDWPNASTLELEASRRGNIPFVANREQQCLSELNDYLKLELPSFMRPRQIFCIDAIPYNLSGKLDRARLPTSKINHRLTQNALRELSTATERQLGSLWKRLLAVDTVGLDDNFFDLGGNSFMFLGFISELEEMFGLKISVMDIMRSSLYEISQKIDSLQNN